jgi:hypothetical protein
VNLSSTGILSWISLKYLGTGISITLGSYFKSKSN